MHFFIRFFSLLLVILVTIFQVNSIYKYVDITDNKSYLFKYDKIKPFYKEKIQNGEITFALHTKNNQTQFLCGKIGCFFFNKGSQSVKDSGKMVMTYNEKNINFPYEITFRKGQKSKSIHQQKKGLDISNKLTVQSIQKRALSCEISASADILSYLLRKKITEDNLLPLLSKSRYNNLPIYKNGKAYWGNPQRGFVGYIHKTDKNIKASQRRMTGYGVLEKPIEKIIHHYGFKTKVITQYNYVPKFTSKQHLTFILKELHKGNMIQLWGDICTNPKYYSGEENPCTYRGKPSWNYERKLTWFYVTSEGKMKKHTGLNGEHAFYLLGYKGNIQNPSHVIVWDTYTGKHTYVTSEWMRKWKKMQYRSLIVYKNL